MQQASLLPHEAQQLAMPDARVHFYPNWLTAAMASQYFETLNDELKWTQQDIVLFGKKYKSPRLQAWYGEPDAVYTYSGLKMTPLAWHETLADIRDECQQKLGVNFNSVLANLYRNGADSMGFHADDEPELGKAPIIASVSLGAMRNLDFVHNRTKQKVRVPLTHGSLLVMQGQTQMHWKHGINKTKRVTMPRINLTFRLVKT